MTFVKRGGAALVFFGAAACAPKVSVPIGEISPDESVAPPAAASALASTPWYAAAERDRVQRGAAAEPVVRNVPRYGTRVELLATAVGPVRYLDLSDITPASVNASPTTQTLQYDSGPAVLRTQILLDRASFSPGAIDGHMGRNTQVAIYWFQYSQRMSPTGLLDAATYNRLASIAGTDRVITDVVVDHDALKGPFTFIPKSVYAQATLRCLCYSSPLELLSERYHTTPEILKLLNPQVKLGSLSEGTRISVPSVDRVMDPLLKPIVRIHISKSGNYVQALAADRSIVFHFPSTLGSAYDPSPDGTFEVTDIARDPVFRYDPMLFSDVPHSKPKATLPPGPNSPVGTVWIALSKEHIGIHGTPTPETIGSASSHGCVRLTNWDAEKLADWVVEGTPVEFVF
jgi:lipoprotein-anchoring transpeptidase ErfK/SrfK